MSDIKKHDVDNTGPNTEDRCNDDNANLVTTNGCITEKPGRLYLQ